MMAPAVAPPSSPHSDATVSAEFQLLAFLSEQLQLITFTYAMIITVCQVTHRVQFDSLPDLIIRSILVQKK